MNQSDNHRKLIGKVELKGNLQCLSGLHIGSSKENMEIGALDSPVVRDPLTRQPYIPGSSVKGKLRALLEKAYPDLLPNRDGGSGISRHECNDWSEGKTVNKNYPTTTMKYPGALNCPVCRLFGSTGPGEKSPGEKNRNYPARVKIRDLHLANRKDLEKIDTGLFLTEWKFENGIDRITSAANPRNIERVPKDAKFHFSLIYDVEDSKTLKEDLENLQLAIKLLHDDSLGGYGSRGYGQIQVTFDGKDGNGVEGRLVDYYRGNPNSVCKVADLSQKSIQDIADFFEKSEG